MSPVTSQTPGADRRVTVPKGLLLASILVWQWCYASALGLYLIYGALVALTLLALYMTVDVRHRAFQVGALLVLFVGAQLVLRGAMPGGQAMNLMLWTLLVPAVVRLASTLPLERARAALSHSQVFALSLMTIDAALRFAFPQPPDATLDFIENNQEGFLYAYKFGGFMFSETNSFGLCALALYVSLRLEPARSLGKLGPLLALVLVCSSLSRTAIGALVLFEVISTLGMTRRNFPFSMFLVYCVVVNITPFALSELIPDDFDGSGRSKLVFLVMFAEYWANLDARSLLFGNGIETSIDVMDHYLHNFFLLALVEIGVAGTVAVLWMMWWAFNRSGLRPLLIVYPIAALSYLFMLAAPALFLGPIVAAMVRSRISNNTLSSSPARGFEAQPGKRNMVATAAEVATSPPRVGS